MKIQKYLRSINLIVGCALIALPTMSTALSIETIAQGKSVKFYAMNTYQEKQQTIITGKIKRRFNNIRVKPGYIAYVVKNREGQMLLSGRTDYSPSLSLRKWKHGSQFQINLPNQLPQNSLVLLHWKPL